MARAARMAVSTARLWRTGSVPGRPRQTGQTLEFGESPKRVEQPQKIFVLVRSWTWTSRPMTGSYLARSSGEMAESVANFVMAKEIKYSRGAGEDALLPVGRESRGRANVEILRASLSDALRMTIITVASDWEEMQSDRVAGERPGRNVRQARK